MEIIMTAFNVDIHAALDAFPHFLSTIRAEFPDDFKAIADEIIDAELGDFCWDSRFAERSIGIVDSFAEDENPREVVKIIGYFRGRYLVASCIVNGDRRLLWMPKVRHFEVLAEAESAFLADG